VPAFLKSLHRAQRWFNLSWLLPAEQGYSRAVPLRWLPAFTTKATRQVYAPCKEWEAAVQALSWLRTQLTALGRATQPVLMVADGSYDTLPLWQQLPPGIILLARTAKNRALWHLPPPGAHRNRKYGERALTPQQYWQQRQDWRHCQLTIRQRVRHLQYRVEGPFLRKTAADCPLFLLIVRGQVYQKHGKAKHRDPMGYLVNAVPDGNGGWQLPLPPETLIFWAWQRWEIEVCHRELKSGFGLGDKQCFHPLAAVASVQWTAWVYALLLLAGYRTWGLCGSPPAPAPWWSGAGRWSLNTLWRAYRAALWGDHHFRPLWSPFPGNWPAKENLLATLTNAAYAAARA
jgi:hypothetical protein